MALIGFLVEVTRNLNIIITVIMVFVHYPATLLKRLTMNTCHNMSQETAG